MAARANVVINDRAGTPVAHTYSPDGDDKNGVHLWSEKGSVPAGNPKLSASVKQVGSKYRVELRLAVPIVQTQTINGVSAPVVVRTANVNLVASFDSLSTTQERADAIGLMANAMAASQTQLNDLLVNVTPVW
nr:MAG: coat protein [Hangzhou fiers-like virus 6]